MGRACTKLVDPSLPQDQGAEVGERWKRTSCAHVQRLGGGRSHPLKQGEA